MDTGNGQGGVKIGFVVVSPAMEAAGLERTRELLGEDLRYIVSSIYLAMEYERLAALGQLSGLDKEAIQIRQT